MKISFLTFVPLGTTGHPGPLYKNCISLECHLSWSDKDLPEGYVPFLGARDVVLKKGIGLSKRQIRRLREAEFFPSRSTRVASTTPIFVFRVENPDNWEKYLEILVEAQCIRLHYPSRHHGDMSPSYALNIRPRS